MIYKHINKSRNEQILHFIYNKHKFRDIYIVLFRIISEQGQTTSKKKTTFSRLLRGLKTHRKEKQAQTQGSPRHGRIRMGVPQRVSVYLCTKP